MRERDIKHEAGDFWVGDVRNTYTVYRANTAVHYSTPDSSYEHTDDGLSIAIARCDYLDRAARLRGIPS